MPICSITSGCWLVVVAGAFLGLPAPGQDFSYSREGQRIEQSQRVIPSGSFTPIRLNELASTFTARCGTTHELLQWIVAPSQRDLMRAGNRPVAQLNPKLVPEYAKDPSLLGQETEPLRAAMFQCLQGNATLYVRDGGQTYRKQLSGNLDARTLSFRSLPLKIVGILLQHFPVADRPDFRDRVTLFMQSKPLPTVEQANALQTYLMSALGCWVRLVIRTDPHFFNYGGPRTDIFEIRRSSTTVTEFVNSRHIICENEEPKCNVLTAPLSDSVKLTK